MYPKPESSSRTMKITTGGGKGPVSMGHKRIDETMIYVHVAENHRREIPKAVVAAAATELDPAAGSPRCSLRVAASRSVSSESAAVAAS